MFVSRFKKILNGGVKVLGVHPTEKPVEIETSDMSCSEVAQRVKFESNDIIRFLTRDNRDILYKLHDDLIRVRYLGETSVLDVNTDANKFKTLETESAFEYLVQRNNQYRAHFAHQKTLKQAIQDRAIVGWDSSPLNQINLITQVRTKV